MVARHREYDGESQVVVVNRALFGDLAPDRIRLLAFQQAGDSLALEGNDDEQHVGGHDGADQRADLNECAASRKYCV